MRLASRGSACDYAQCSAPSAGARIGCRDAPQAPARSVTPPEPVESQEQGKIAQNPPAPGLPAESPEPENEDAEAGASQQVAVEPAAFPKTTLG